MNTLQQAVSAYIAETGESKRSISLRAGLRQKAVADLLAVDSCRPRRAAIDALAAAMGRELPCDELPERLTFAALIARLPQKVGDAGKAQRLAQRLRWLMRAAGWVAEFETVDRAKVTTFFAHCNAATFGISSRSLATYKAEVMTALDLAMPRARARMISDLTGIYAEAHDALKLSTLPADLAMASGSFLVFLNDLGIAPKDVTTATLEQYFQHRLEVSTKGEGVARKHVKRIATLIRFLATRPEFEGFGFVQADHPFGDGRDRYAVVRIPG